MRIGIDGGCLSNHRGFGRYARWALEALAESGSGHELVVILDKTSADSVRVPAGVEVRLAETREAPSKAATATGRRSLRDLFAMGKAASRAKLDLLFFPATYSFFPVWNVPRVVITMHDALTLRYPELVFPNKRGYWFWHLKERIALKAAKRVLTPSEASKRDLLSYYKLPPERVSVTPLGPEPVFRTLPAESAAETEAVLGRWGIDPSRRFVLYVGGLSPHKNLIRLIEAFAKAADPGVDLILVGDFRDVFLTEVPAICAAIERGGLGERVRLTGFVPDEDLVHLYNRAEFLVQPSLMEGFGLPPVEAMACGLPVASSTAGSLPEVVGDGGRYFDPTDVGAMAGVLRELLESPAHRSELAGKALERSRHFAREAAAARLLGIFEDLAARGAA